MRGVRCGLRTIRAGLMAGICLGAVEAHAADGVWSTEPVSNNWNNAANWSSNPPDMVPDGTATFSLGSTKTSITFFFPTTNVQTIQFINPIPAYSFDLSGHALTIGGKGIELIFLPAAPNFTQSDISSLTFTGTASASTGPAQANGGLGANITNTNNPFLGGGTSFFNSSTAGSAKILNTNLGTTAFYDQSGAGSAKIINDNFGATVFKGQSFMAGASILNAHSGGTFFNENSVAGIEGKGLVRPTIVNETGGFTIFTDNASVFYLPFSDVTGVQITNQRNGGPAGTTEFRGNSNAGYALITNLDFGTTTFRDSSSLGFATITNGPGGATIFLDHSGPGGDFPQLRPTITNTGGGVTEFHDHSSAVNAVITNNADGRLDFFDNSRAGGADIVNKTGGATIFRDNSCGVEATITNDGGTTAFIDNSSPGNATFHNQRRPHV